MLRITTLLFALLFSLCSTAQQYDQAFGVRVGLSQGLTYKQFTNRDFAFEAMALIKNQAYNLTALVEKHNDLLDTRGLFWYYGVGGHVDIALPSDGHETGKSVAFYLGIDAILGFEYNLRRLPFSLSMDWKPTMRVQQASGNFKNEGALSVRYTW
jgi:hypothetical protein